MLTREEILLSMKLVLKL